MKQSRKSWTEEEDEVMKSLIRKYGTKKWKSISDKMTERFPQEGRSGKQCRQRWYNHLCPNINKEPWEEEQIKVIFDSHKRFGNKWTDISALLNGRTDNAVKNQFYSSLRKGLRRICRILGNRKNTQRIRQVKPSVLCSILSNINQIISESEVYDTLFLFSQEGKYNELKSKTVTGKEEEKLDLFLQKILQSSEQYRRKWTRNRGKKNHLNQNTINENRQNHSRQLPELNFHRRWTSNDQIPSNPQQMLYSEVKSLEFEEINLEREFQLRLDASANFEPVLFHKKSSSGDRSFKNKPCEQSTKRVPNKLNHLFSKNASQFNGLFENSPVISRAFKLGPTPKGQTSFPWPEYQHSRNQENLEIQYDAIINDLQDKIKRNSTE